MTAAPGPESWLLAVDFGTSNTAAAHTGIRSGAPETLALTHHGNLMPSAVFVESPETIEVGDVALNRAETNPGAFIASPKRVIGQSMLTANGYDLPTWVPVAAVLRVALAVAAGAHRGQSPSRLVLTHPEGWSPREVRVLREAAGRLGFDASRVVTLSEPRAAAHFYTRPEALTAGSSFAVFDFGGGTLDIAVLTAGSGGSFDIVAARGDNALGGKNLDSLIRRWVDTCLAEENPDLLRFLRSGAPPHLLHTLDDSIRRAKELLSSTESATISVADSRSDHRVQLTLTRDVLEDIIGPEIDRAITLARHTLDDAGVGPGRRSVQAVYLTGGSSRIPLVGERVAQLGPIATLDDPKTVVVQGALLAVERTPSVHGAATGSQYAAAPTAASGPLPSVPTTPASFAAAPSTSTAPAAGSTSAPGGTRSRRTAILLGGGVAAAAAIGAGVWLTVSGGDPAAVAPTVAAGSPQDVQSVKDRATEYFSVLNVDRDAAKAMQCSTYKPVEDAEPNPPERRFGVKEFIAANVVRDSATVRLRLTVMDGDVPSPFDGDIMLMNFVRESGEWQFCSATNQ